MLYVETKTNIFLFALSLSETKGGKGNDTKTGINNKKEERQRVNATGGRG